MASAVAHANRMRGPWLQPWGTRIDAPFVSPFSKEVGHPSRYPSFRALQSTIRPAAREPSPRREGRQVAFRRREHNATRARAVAPVRFPGPAHHRLRSLHRSSRSRVAHRSTDSAVAHHRSDLPAARVNSVAKAQPVSPAGWPTYRAAVGGGARSSARSTTAHQPHTP
jgi:hypothetical protein